MQNPLSIDEQESLRLAQIENENERHNQKAFRDYEFMGIKDEYFDEPTPEVNSGTESKNTEL